MERTYIYTNEDRELTITDDSSNIYKDALFNSLYSQIEFLKTELTEKNILIKSLLIKESVFYRNQHYHNDSSDSDTDDDASDTTEVNESNVYNHDVNAVDGEIQETSFEQSVS